MVRVLTGVRSASPIASARLRARSKSELISYDLDAPFLLLILLYLMRL